MDRVKVIRSAIQKAYCMDLDEYRDLFGLTSTIYKERGKKDWRTMQENFGKWFCDLDLYYAELFMKWVKVPWKPGSQLEAEAVWGTCRVSNKTGWREHPNWTMEDWADEVGCLNTRLGYWEWVMHMEDLKDD